MNVDHGYRHCPTCNALVRVIGRYTWGDELSRHLTDGSWCPASKILHGPDTEGEGS